MSTVLKEDHNAHVLTLPLWQSHKKVRAVKIKSVTPIAGSRNYCIEPVDGSGVAPFEVEAFYYHKHKPQAGWYYVVYEDGYKSASPPEAFEGGYNLIAWAPVTPPAKSEPGMKKLELIVMAYRYGWAIAGLHLVNDATYDAILAQVRAHVDKGSPLQRPTSKDAKDYDVHVIGQFELQVVATLQHVGLLKRLSKPSMEEFNFQAFIDAEARKVFADVQLTPQDHRAILEKVQQNYPWAWPESMAHLLNTPAFEQFKRALVECTVVHVTR